MAKNKNQKQNLINLYKDLISKAQSMYFFAGNLNAAKTTELKKALSDGSKLSLLKNTIFNIAAKNSNLELELNDYNNVVFVNESIIEDANILNKFCAENEYKMIKVTIGKSIYEGNKLKQISSLGSQSQVNTKLVSILSTPASMLVRGLNSPIQKLASVLSQIQK